MTPIARRSVLAVAAASLAGCMGAAAPTADGATTVEATDVITIDAACGDEESAAVAVEDDVVTVDGAITAPNPCHEAVLGNVTVAGDQLSIHIDVVSTGEEVCIECVGRIEYEATVRVRDADALGSVHVIHADGESFTHDLA